MQRSPWTEGFLMPKENLEIERARPCNSAQISDWKKRKYKHRGITERVPKFPQRV